MYSCEMLLFAGQICPLAKLTTGVDCFSVKLRREPNSLQIFRRSAVILISTGVSETELHRDPSGSLLVCVCGNRRVWAATPKAFTLGRGSEEEGGVCYLSDEFNPIRGALWEGPGKYTFDMSAGDAVYIPVGWWHAVAVSSLSNTGSIAVTFECTSSQRDAVVHKVIGVGRTNSFASWTSAKKLLTMLVAVGVTFPPTVRALVPTRNVPTLAGRIGESRKAR